MSQSDSSSSTEPAVLTCTLPSKRKDAPPLVAFKGVPKSKLKSLKENIPLDVEVDFICICNTKIRFSEHNYYQIFHKESKLTYSSTYECLFNAISLQLASKYKSPLKKHRHSNFVSATLPIGTSLFGRVPKKNGRNIHVRTNALEQEIGNHDQWRLYVVDNVIFEDVSMKRNKIRNQKSVVYPLPSKCKVQLAMVIEEEEKETDMTSISTKVSKVSTKKKKKQPVLRYPHEMQIDIISPCLRKEDKVNHTIKYSVGISTVLLSYPFNLQPYIQSGKSFYEMEDLESSFSCSGSEEEIKDDSLELKLTEFRASVGSKCINEVDAYALEKGVIGNKSILFGSTKTGLQVEPIRSSEALKEFIKNVVMKTKSAGTVKVRLCFGVSQPGDSIENLSDLEIDEDGVDYRHSQNPMNEPKNFMSGKEMSRQSRTNPEDIKKFLNNSYMNGPLKHGFAEEHRKLLLAKLNTYPEKVKEFESDRDPKTIFDLIEKSDIKKSCFELEPKTGEYLPTNPMCNTPPTLREWAHKNGKKLGDQVDEVKTLQMEMMRKQMALQDTMAKSLESKNGGHNMDRPAVVNNISTRRNKYTLNLAREFNGRVRFKSVYFGDGQRYQTSMALSSLMQEIPKFFTKETDRNELQLEIKINEQGDYNYIDEDDFDDTSVQDLIDKCLFDTSKSPIVIKIKEWDT